MNRFFACITLPLVVINVTSAFFDLDFDQSASLIVASVLFVVFLICLIDHIKGE